MYYTHAVSLTHTHTYEKAWQQGGESIFFACVLTKRRITSSMAETKKGGVDLIGWYKGAPKKIGDVSPALSELNEVNYPRSAEVFPMPDYPSLQELRGRVSRP